MLADVPHVATDIAPVHALVSRVMDGVGTPELVVPPSASPHGYAMRPSEALNLARADIGEWVGPALTPRHEEPLETLSGDAQQLQLMSTPGTSRIEAGCSLRAHTRMITMIMAITTMREKPRLAQGPMFGLIVKMHKTEYPYR